MPTRVAANAPNMWEKAIRWGIAVIGTNTPERVADQRTDDQADHDPAVADDLVLDQGADDGDEHPDRRQHHPPAGLFRFGQAPEAENE